MGEFDQIETAILRKSSEIPIQVTLKRSGLKENEGGLLVEVKTLPIVESFFANLSVKNGTVDVRTFGRDWSSHPNKEEPLIAYQFDKPFHNMMGPGGYRLDKLAASIIFHDPNYGNHVNLSFLRLVGTSRGVAFRTQGVYHTDQVLELKESVTRALRDFYQAYLKPMNITISLVTQEL